MLFFDVHLAVCLSLEVITSAFLALVNIAPLVFATGFVVVVGKRKQTE